MPIFRLSKKHLFPHPSLAEPSGLLAVGGDLHPQRLLLAYAQGIFPWYSENQPILWFSPEPRYVLFPDRLRISRSLRKRVRRGDFEIRLDTAFDEVIKNCRQTHRPGQRGTWITPAMQDAYRELFRLGFAHSAEAYLDGKLVGGLYGVALGKVFAGESMFAHASDASKVAFVWLIAQLQAWGYELVDCQVYTDHLARFGAEELPRQSYLGLLRQLITDPGRVQHWTLDPGFHPLAD